MFTSILILRCIKIELDRLKEESKGVCSSRAHILQSQRTRQLHATESLVSSLNPDAESICHLCWWRGNAQLLERTEPVSQTPMFHHLAILDPEDVDGHHADRLAGGSGCPERTLVGAMDADQGHHFVPVSQQVHHGRFHVGEGSKVHIEKLARPMGQARRRSGCLKTRHCIPPIFS
jgi:hypothetical protein